MLFHFIEFSVFSFQIQNKNYINKPEKCIYFVRGGQKFPLWWRKIKIISAVTAVMLKISATCLFRHHSGKYF
jgi:hypothetical protein